MRAERLFSYGTLQLESVQLATFGRRLAGDPDTLLGYVVRPLVIEDAAVIAVSGQATHTIATFTGNDHDTIPGTVFLVSLAEIAMADRYEVSPCVRVAVTLRSGRSAWAYVDGRHGDRGSPDNASG